MSITGQGRAMRLSVTTPNQAREVGQTDVYRLIVFDASGTAVLLEPDGDEYRLPKVEIPKFTRPAKEVTETLRKSWHMSSVFLFSGLLQKLPEADYFAALESKNGLQLSPSGMNWFTIHHALSNLLLLEEERRAVKSSYRKAINRIQVNPREPFCRIGWMRELEGCIQDLLRLRGVELKGFEQLNGCETFSLVRFDTTQQPVWFKAVGEPNLHEYPISLTLARLLPKYVPNVLATKPEWRGWLMSDGGGPTLDELQDLSAWQNAVITLANLQIDSVSVQQKLLEAGCRDLRTTALLELVDPFLDSMAELMLKQMKVPPPVLSRQELSCLGVTLRDALHCLGALGIPDTLGHSDFNPGNIVVGSESCTFIDWAEAHVGHPFLTFEYLISQLKKDYPALLQFEEDIKSCYTQRWQSLLSPEQVSEALSLTPLVAVFAYAVAGGAWRDQERLKIPQVPGYLRGLARRMKKEADSIQKRRVECHQ